LSLQNIDQNDGVQLQNLSLMLVMQCQKLNGIEKVQHLKYIALIRQLYIINEKNRMQYVFKKPRYFT